MTTTNQASTPTDPSGALRRMIAKQAECQHQVVGDEEAYHCRRCNKPFDTHPNPKIAARNAARKAARMAALEAEWEVR